MWYMPLLVRMWWKSSSTSVRKTDGAATLINNVASPDKVNHKVPLRARSFQPTEETRLRGKHRAVVTMTRKGPRRDTFRRTIKWNTQITWKEILEEIHQGADGPQGNETRPVGKGTHDTCEWSLHVLNQNISNLKTYHVETASSQDGQRTSW